MSTTPETLLDDLREIVALSPAGSLAQKKALAMIESVAAANAAPTEQAPKQIPYFVEPCPTCTTARICQYNGCKHEPTEQAAPVLDATGERKKDVLRDLAHIEAFIKKHDAAEAMLNRLADVRSFVAALSQTIAEDEPFAWARKGLKRGDDVMHNISLYSMEGDNWMKLYTRPQPQPAANMSEAKLFEISRAAAESVAKNANVAPQLCYAPIYLALKDAFPSDAEPQELPVMSDEDRQKLEAERKANRELRDAVWNLMAQKGRHNTEIAYRQLEPAYLKAVKASPALSRKPADGAK